MTRTAIPLLVALALAVGATQADGATFDGACSGTAENTETVPIGLIPRPTEHVAGGTGTCSGVLDGAPVRDLAVTYGARLHDIAASCVGGWSDHGTVEVDFGAGRTAAYEQHSLAAFVLTGPQAEGLFTAIPDFLTGNEDPTTANRCLAGTEQRYRVRWALRTH